MAPFFHTSEPPRKPGGFSRSKAEFEAVLGRKAAKRYQIRKFGRRAIDYLYGFDLEASQIVVR